MDKLWITYEIKFYKKRNINENIYLKILKKYFYMIRFICEVNMTNKNEEKIEHIHSDECECNECECGHHHLEECHCSECDSEENYDEESIEKYDADGIDNKEHLLDLFEEAEMLYDNIKDNTIVLLKF